MSAIVSPLNYDGLKEATLSCDPQLRNGKRTELPERERGKQIRKRVENLNEGGQTRREYRVSEICSLPGTGRQRQ